MSNRRWWALENGVTDHELMERTALGDAQAFAQLVRRWEQRVGRVLSVLVGSAADLDDLAQEVFVRVHQARHRYRAVGSFAPWLHRIVLNVARDARRRRRRWEELDPAQLPDVAALPSEAAQQRERDSTVMAAVAALPESLREVLLLRHFGELTFAEVASLVGRPVSTVKSQVALALEKLRFELKRRGIDQKTLENA